MLPEQIVALPRMDIVGITEAPDGITIPGRTLKFASELNEVSTNSSGCRTNCTIWLMAVEIVQLCEVEMCEIRG